MIFTWNVNPIALSFFSFSVHWYGIFFALGFFIGYFFVEQIFKKLQINTSTLDKLLIYMFLGTIIGARLGHCFFYQPEYFISHPLEIFKVWQGGLASHGGGIGLVLSVLLFCKIYHFNFFSLADILCIPTAFEGSLIRIGNFFNSEIYGKATNSDYGVIFSRLGDDTPRHPCQIYESISYLIISLILFFLFIKLKQKYKGAVLRSFLILIFTTRFFIEFLKPEQADFNLFFLTMGQYLSIPFVVIGLFLLIFSLIRRNKKV